MSKEVEFSATDLAFFDYFYSGDGRGGDGEDFFDTNTTSGYFTDDKVFACSRTSNGNNDTLKDLCSGFFAFFYSQRHFNGVTDTKLNLVLPGDLICHWHILPVVEDFFHQFSQVVGKVDSIRKLNFFKIIG